MFLSNGPGDPAATGEYAVPTIQALLDRDVPIFGICLGHQMLGLAAGAQTSKMHQGHRGANHPVKRLADGVVEITSMNHGFAVDNATLPERRRGNPRLAVRRLELRDCDQGQEGVRGAVPPEASPGPHDSYYLFEKFVGMLGCDDRARWFCSCGGLPRAWSSPRFEPARFGQRLSPRPAR